MRLKLIIILLLLNLCCKELDDESGFEKIQLLYVAKEKNHFIKSGTFVDGDFLTLTILKFYYKKSSDSLAWTKGVTITFPIVNDSFNITDNSIHHYSLETFEGTGLSDVKSEEITNGEIYGNKIDSLSWYIKIHIKEFTLNKVLHFKLNKPQKETIK